MTQLREAVYCPSPNRVTYTLSSDKMAAGLAPPEILPYFCGATFLARKKKGGRLRPIAIGKVLRCLVSKCLATATRPATLSLLALLQLEVEVKGVCEVIIHATSHLMFTASPNYRWTLLVDFSNVFNNISREAMFVEMRKHIPSLSAWMEACYSCQPFLYLGENTIHSCCRVQ